MTERDDALDVALPLEREGTTRRTFLRLAGYGVAAATLAACSRAPASKIVPRLESSDGLVPGRRYRLATTCGGCAAGCGVLAEVRDGRPVKLEGNPDHPVSGGGLCAVGQAQVLSLYDGRRFGGPRVRGAATTWESADAEVRAALAASKGRVRLLTGTDSSPSTRAWIDRFCREHGSNHVVHDAVPSSAILDAHGATHGGRMLPRYRFDRARTIVSFGADFLGTWISPVEFARGWAAGRRPDGPGASMSRHFQFESRVSLTGTNADRRVVLPPWETATALAELCVALASKSGVAPPFPAPSQGSSAGGAILDAAETLWTARPAALVVSDDDSRDAQVLVNFANHLLGAYETTVCLARASSQRAGDVRAVAALVEEMERGEVGVLVVSGANPLYDLPDVPRVRAALARVPLVITCAGAPDETADLASIVCPTPHALESWDDAEPFRGTFSLRQPAIRPLRRARTLRESLAHWCGDMREDRELLRAHWRETVHPVVSPAEGFDAFFARALHDGFVDAPADRQSGFAFHAGAVSAPVARNRPAQGTLAIVLHAQVGIPDGSHAHNAWLQELPDPVTKVTWDNVAALSPATARALGVEDGDVVRVAVAGGAAIDVPVCVQPGQHDGVVAVALGYGRSGTDRFASVAPEWIEGRPTVEPGGTIGASASPLLSWRERGLVLAGTEVRVVKTTAPRRTLARTQAYASLSIPEHLAPKGGVVRDAVRATTFAAIASEEGRGHDAAHAVPDLWQGRAKRSDVRWGLAIDLSKCIGCSACVVSCQAENNVPVVGRDEVARRRDMHWIRIDRYWTGDGADGTAWHQPMMCQHCGNAPCETVCPVLATVHSAEGLNQQVYNRCVGTRYCANNCPYKVRRFNWFDYPRDDALANLALNPDVTVRSRGVMEKCSLCLQRILRARSEARREGREVRDGDVRTACQESCPTSAIVFGDLADRTSEAARLAASGRSYRVLEELRVEPGVEYLAAVRNPPDGGEGGDDAR